MGRWMSKVNKFDAALLVFQIIAVQSIHYLSLSIITPLLLHLFGNDEALRYEWGSSPPCSIGLILDWRELANWDHGEPVWQGLWIQGIQRGRSANIYEWDGSHNRSRGWVLAICWVFACFVDIIPLYYLIRKPTLILDFALTITGLHFLFTTAHVQSPPVGFFCYGVYALGVVVLVVGAEQLAMRRELTEGLWGDKSNEQDYEMSTRHNHNQHVRSHRRPTGLGLVLDSPDNSPDKIRNTQ
ncbi:hypothetical protein E3P81_01261 [Wallemia ichthyophaga]|uniref:Uncharacterized protein n=1 Tax=Wallemia ichthyophaga TaxID=245174 RepID=A0A4T0IZ92_WALIC|nr:hypothetical protein E3P98_01087 [Wallemia ichthyophaga]TIA92769.1 hypothetical protein E3P97_01262 [Wallemia ichthyophaga]TIA96981.1 hypothetical protein E3P95_03061 [Wallemia ichthyophaga]TIA98280.1 hypothetical protein E3P94_02981 [Wallemia ichthyophaga]TIB34172.1 hypothetical protein E3P85_01011 [Wallemia ichthyophaga]